MEEDQLWIELYKNRIDKLNHIFENSNTINRGRILEGLEALSTDSFFQEKPRQTKKTKIDYYHQIADDDTTKKIELMFQNPDKNQINLIYSKYGRRNISQEIGIRPDSLSGVKTFLINGEGASYQTALFAHWLLNHGYEIKE